MVQCGGRKEKEQRGDTETETKDAPAFIFGFRASSSSFAFLLASIIACIGLAFTRMRPRDDMAAPRVQPEI